MKQILTRGNFVLDTSMLRTQQSTEHFYEGYLPEHHPELLREFDKLFGEPYSQHAQRMAMRSCVAVTAWNFLKSAGRLDGVSLEPFIDSVWEAFDYTNSLNWLRGSTTKIIRDVYGIRIVSAGVKWLNEPVTQESVDGMLRVGYCGDMDDVAYYIDKMHGKSVEDIVREQPAIITIKSPVGKQIAHAVFAWDIDDHNQLRYYNSDKRQEPLRDGLCVLDTTALQSRETNEGAVTVIVD